jgi:hypothetical protein
VSAPNSPYQNPFQQGASSLPPQNTNTATSVFPPQAQRSPSDELEFRLSTLRHQLRGFRRFQQVDPNVIKEVDDLEDSITALFFRSARISAPIAEDGADLRSGRSGDSQSSGALPSPGPHGTRSSNVSRSSHGSSSSLRSPQPLAKALALSPNAVTVAGCKCGFGVGKEVCDNCDTCVGVGRGCTTACGCFKLGKTCNNRYNEAEAE